MGIRAPNLTFLTGLALLALALFASPPASATPKTPAATFTTLYSFCQQNDCTDGQSPAGGVVVNSAGTVFGTTCYGGADGNGTAFSITKKGVETVRASFDGPNGACPQNANLLEVSATEFFGTTAFGGANEDCGTVFKLSQNGGKWVLTTLYSFFAYDGDGCEPSGGLIRDAKGNLYGVTYGGGDTDYGIVYELSPPKKSNGAWTEQMLYSFCSEGSCEDGANPTGTLAMDKSGTLYGTTLSGGFEEDGVLFAIPPYGGEAVLYSFCQEVPYCTDGYTPSGGVTLDAQGDIFGTTAFGGTGFYNGDGYQAPGGTVFKFSAKGRFTSLYSFCSAGE